MVGGGCHGVGWVDTRPSLLRCDGPDLLSYPPPLSTLFPTILACVFVVAFSIFTKVILLLNTLGPVLVISKVTN